MKKLKRYFGLDSASIGRLRFFISNISALAVLVVSFPLGFLIIASFGLARQGFAGVIVLLLSSVGAIFWFYVLLSTSARRLKSLGQSHYWVLLYFVPGVWFFFFAYLCLGKGELIKS